MIHELVRFFRHEQPDVVHLHNFLCQVRAGLGARLARVPVVIATKHGSEWPRCLGSRHLAAGFYRLADVLVAVSPDVRDGLLATYGFAPERVRLILNGVDTDRFRPMDGDCEKARQRIPGVTGTPLLGTVGRLVGYKGVGTLLEAFRIVLQRAPEAGLVIVGDGADRASFENQAASLGIAARVHFLGNRSDVCSIYPLLDVYVQPSYTEGISLTMLEACACALPVVATKVGGNPEIVVDGQTGRLVPPRDPSALAAGILEHLGNARAAHAMGRSARQRVVELFSLDRMVHDYLALYDEVRDRRLRAEQGEQDTN
jgi:glycosyltransferase involved in cell wall biosynthesis